MIQKNVSEKATVSGTTITVKAPETFLLSTRENSIEPGHIDGGVISKFRVLFKGLFQFFVKITDTNKQVCRSVVALSVLLYRSHLLTLTRKAVKSHGIECYILGR